MSKIKIIVGIVDKTRGIGINGDQPYFISEDLKRFKELTKGGTVIMGSKTFFAIPEKFRPLPGRLNIVLSRNENLELPQGVRLANSFEEAMVAAENSQREIWIMGGAEIYKLALEYSKDCEIYITRIKGNATCDTFFPEFENHYNLKDYSSWYTDDKNNVKYRFEVWTAPV